MNVAMKPATRRRSLTAKYQAFFSNSSQNSNSDSHDDVEGSKPLHSTVTPTSRVKSVSLTTASPVANDEPQEPPDPGLHKPATLPDIPAVPRLRRRPKTPVRKIGQLEGLAQYSREEFPTALDEALAENPAPVYHKKPLSLAEVLAETCESLYGSGTPPLSPTTPRSLRKVSGLQNLRRTSNSSGSEPSSPDFSDGETYVGLDLSPGASTRMLKHLSASSLSSGGSLATNSTSSYHSAVSEQDFGSSCKKERSSLPPRRSPNPSRVNGAKVFEYAHNIEMKICLDLLKTDLASALPPRSPSDSTMALQLWLMIESYEALKRRLRQQLARETGPGTDKTSQCTFEVLDHWLEALYSVYNSQLRLPDRRRSFVV